MRPLHPNYLLALWVQFHGEVAPRYHSVFLERPEIQELVHYPGPILKEAFASSPRLKEILEKARELSPGVRRNLSPKKPAPRSKKEEILPLPGDPVGTRRPGNREDYRTGPEAELRHIAQKYKWWE